VTNLRFEGVIAALTATGTRLQLDADADTAFPPTERSDLWVPTPVLFFLFFFVFFLFFLFFFSLVILGS